MTADKYSPKWLLNKIKESKTDTHKLLHIIEYQNEIAKQSKQLILSGVGKNEAICNCENEYWKEDEGGDWYCTIHDKLSTVQNESRKVFRKHRIRKFN